MLAQCMSTTRLEGGSWQTIYRKMAEASPALMYPDRAGIQQEKTQIQFHLGLAVYTAACHPLERAAQRWEGLGELP